jgi:hypothetical protein
MADDIVLALAGPSAWAAADRARGLPRRPFRPLAIGAPEGPDLARTVYQRIIAWPVTEPAIGPIAGKYSRLRLLLSYLASEATVKEYTYSYCTAGVLQLDSGPRQ